MHHWDATGTPPTGTDPDTTKTPPLDTTKTRPPQDTAHSFVRTSKNDTNTEHATRLPGWGDPCKTHSPKLRPMRRAPPPSQRARGGPGACAGAPRPLERRRPDDLGDAPLPGGPYDLGCVGGVGPQADVVQATYAAARAQGARRPRSATVVGEVPRRPLLDDVSYAGGGRPGACGRTASMTSRKTLPNILIAARARLWTTTGPEGSATQYALCQGGECVGITAGFRRAAAMQSQ